MYGLRMILTILTLLLSTLLLSVNVAFADDAPATSEHLIIQALKSEDTYVRHRAALALVNLTSGETAVLVAALQSEDPHVRQKATDVLGKFASEGQAMRAALESDDPRVRQKAAQMLESVSSSDFVPLMQIALDSEDPYVRHQAAQLLSQMDPGTWEVSWEKMQQVDAAPVIATPTPAAPPEPDEPTPWHSNRYRGWEQNWSANWPDCLDLEPDELQLRYNRVEGPYAGWRLPRNYRARTGVAHFGEGGYAFGAEDWQFRAGGELYTFYGLSESFSHLATVGGEVHDVSDSQDGWLISAEENSIDAILFRRDFYDYYRRFGWTAYSAHNVGGILQLTATYSRDEFESRDNAVSWVLVGNRFSRDQFRPNPQVDEGIVSSARLDLQLDTRNSRNDPWQGWLINGLLERAGGFMNGDHTFKRYLLDLRRYQPVSPGTRLDLRLRTGTAKETLPAQYLYDLGGISTLRGYGFKEFTGDRMVLINLEYWIDADRHWSGSLPDLPVDELGLGVFFDAGSAWFADDRGDPFEGAHEPELKRSYGFVIGESDQDLRIQLARPLDGAEEEWKFLVRFGRSF